MEVGVREYAIHTLNVDVYRPKITRNIGHTFRDNPLLKLDTFQKTLITIQTWTNMLEWKNEVKQNEKYKRTKNDDTHTEIIYKEIQNQVNTTIFFL